MRIGELLGLRWSDVDLDSGGVTIHRALVRSGGDWLLAEPKTRRSRRQVTIAGRAVTALRAHKARQAEARLAAGPGWTDHGLIFTDRWGSPLIGAHVTERRLKPLLKAAGLPPIRFHDLRHTAATLMLARGVNAKVVSEMLGHATVAFTLDVYAHSLPTMQAEAARALDAVMGGAE